MDKVLIYHFLAPIPQVMITHPFEVTLQISGNIPFLTCYSYSCYSVDYYHCQKIPKIYFKVTPQAQSILIMSKPWWKKTFYTFVQINVNACGNTKIKTMSYTECAGQALQEWSPQPEKPLSEMVFICYKVVHKTKAIGPLLFRGDKENWKSIQPSCSFLFLSPSFFSLTQHLKFLILHRHKNIIGVRSLSSHQSTLLNYLMA